jgi:hypothetical protein
VTAPAPAASESFGGESGGVLFYVMQRLFAVENGVWVQKDSITTPFWDWTMYWGATCALPPDWLGAPPPYQYMDCWRWNVMTPGWVFQS